jgi:hypothetical protein
MIKFNKNLTLNDVIEKEQKIKKRRSWKQQKNQ